MSQGATEGQPYDLVPFRQAWDRFAGWFATHAPEEVAVIQPPLSEKQIAEVERVHGFALHPEVAELLRLQGGVPWNTPLYGHLLPIGHRLSTVDHILGAHGTLLDFHADYPENWGEWQEMFTEEPVHAHAHQWLVFAEPNDGGMAFVDHAPGPTYGHVYEFGMGSGADDVTLWATSLTELFDTLATALETGAPFQSMYPVFQEMLHTDLPHLADRVGKRTFTWDHQPDRSFPDVAVHRVTRPV
jgi:cell wall assembly regulator SMI1